MNEVVEFYKLISPLVLEEKFCMDSGIKLSDKNHPVCPSNPKNHGIVAGIRRKNSGMKGFITRDENEFDISKIILILIILYLLFLILKNSKIVRTTT